MDEELQLRFLDGPKLVEWLMEEGVQYRHLTDAQQRRWSDWRRGCRADLYSNTVDRILTEYYLSSRLIPDDVWSRDQLNKNAGRKQRPPAEQKRLRAEGRLLLAAGCSIVEVRTKLGVSEQAVRKWRKDLEKEEPIAA